MSENQVNTYYVSIKGDDSNPGTLELPFRSINNAVSKVKAGDTIFSNFSNLAINFLFWAIIS